MIAIKMLFVAIGSWLVGSAIGDFFQQKGWNILVGAILAGFVGYLIGYVAITLF